MMPASVKPLTLEEFFKLSYSEESPAWKHIKGDAMQKPMPKTSTLSCFIGYSLSSIATPRTTRHFLNFVVPLAGVLLYLMLQ
jgi:Uma2 family endonuclease